MPESRKEAAGTLGAGGVGLASAGLLSHKSMRRAYLEDTQNPVPRPKNPLVPHQVRLIKHPRGRKTYLAGVGLAAASTPVLAVGASRLTRTYDKKDTDDSKFIRGGIKGAEDAIRERSKSHLQVPVKHNAAALGVGAGAAGLGGLAAHTALSRAGIKGGVRAALTGAASGVSGAASIPVQGKVVEARTGGEYTVGPAGVRRKKKPAVRPSRGALMVDQRSGQVLPPGVSKSDDPGAGMSQAKRRALVTGSGVVPIPVVGDAMMATQAGRLSPEGYRRRTTAQVFAANNAGNLAGLTAGTLGAAYLADKSKRASAALTRANTRYESTVSGAKDAVSARVPDNVKSRVPTNRPKVNLPVPPRVNQVLSNVASSRAGKLVARNKAPAAIGGIAGAAIGGQVAMQSAYGHIMRRDDRYRDANRLSRGVSKRKNVDEMTPQERGELARRKMKAAHLSIVSGTSGMGALGATLAAPVLRRSRIKYAGAVANGLETVNKPLLAISSGVGGYSSLNYARMQRQEARNLAPTVAKSEMGVVEKAIFGVRMRRPAVRIGHLRRYRTPYGVRTTTVRGSFR